MRPSDAILHDGSWSTVVQVMACHLINTSLYLKQCWLIFRRSFRKKIDWNFIQNTKIFLPEILMKFHWNFSTICFCAKFCRNHVIRTWWIQNKLSIEFEFWLENHHWIGPCNLFGPFSVFSHSQEIIHTKKSNLCLTLHFCRETLWLTVSSGSKVMRTILPWDSNIMSSYLAFLREQYNAGIHRISSHGIHVPTNITFISMVLKIPTAWDNINIDKQASDRCLWDSGLSPRACSSD